jgi:TrmH family RNA methyltransferase
MTKPPHSITSASNPLIKMLRGLDRKRNRSETGLFLAEGTRLVLQGFNNGWKADALVCATSMIDRPIVADLIERAQMLNTKVVDVPDRVMEQITRKDNPGAVVAAFRQQHRKLADLPALEQGIWLALYEIRDPGNLGTILRTADCAGLAGVVLIGTCCDPYSVEAVRASMGSVFDIDFASSDFDTFNSWRRDARLHMVAASVNGTVRHDLARYTNKAVIIMGNEQAGLPPDVEAACDTLALIPMRGGADSLNLAQATAIMSYEAWRQHAYAGAREPQS